MKQELQDIDQDSGIIINQNYTRIDMNDVTSMTIIDIRVNEKY